MLLAMGIEGTVPRRLSRVHPRFRTPYVAVVAFTLAAVIGAWTYLLIFLGDSVVFDGFVEVAVVGAYTLLAVSCLRFLRRIGEDARATTVIAVGITGVGAGLLGFLAFSGIVDGQWGIPSAVLVVGMSGVVWAAVLKRTRPESLATMGAFDSPETADLLPGAGELVLDDAGRPQLVSAHPSPGDAR